MLLVFIVVLLGGGGLSMQLRRLLVMRPAFCGTVVAGQALVLPGSLSTTRTFPLPWPLLPLARLIWMVFTRTSGCGRARSMCSSPLSSHAPFTSIPSASTNARWNCRAAMPRCRKTRPWLSSV